MKPPEEPDARPASKNAQPTDQPEPSTQALERLQQEAQTAKDHYVRAVAEFENTKKRLQREKEEFAKYAAEGVVRELLPVMDSLDQALVAVDKQADPEAIVKGVHLIYRQLLGLLEKEGVKRIPTIGEPFDPHRHEAVGHVPTEHGAKENTITDEVQIGYTMHGKVIRPSMVKVAKDQKSEIGNRKSDQAESKDHLK